MPAGLPVALALLAEAAAAISPGTPARTLTASAAPVYGPKAPAPLKKVLAKASVENSCASSQASANPREIVICAQRPNGYRLNPDVMEAKREAKEALAHGPRPPEGRYPQNDCATVGPMGCRGGAGISLAAVAITAVAMAKRLAEGKEIGSMFVTDPQPDEYLRYVEAKRRREALKAQAAATARIQAAQADGAAPAVADAASARP